VLVGIAVYVMLWMNTSDPKWNIGGVNARLAAHAAAVPMLLVVSANCTRSYGELFGPYLVSLTVMFSFVFWKHIHIHALRGGRSRLSGVLGCCAGAWTVTVLLPGAILAAGNRAMFGILAVAIPACLVADAYQQMNPRPAEAGYWRASDFVTTAAAALALLILQYARVLPIWRIIA
jgi:hypothetical protein